MITSIVQLSSVKCKQVPVTLSWLHLDREPNVMCVLESPDKYKMDINNIYQALLSQLDIVDISNS